MNLKVYGSRASIPFFSRESIRTGGNTSCFKLEMNGHTMIFDCGTGIMQFHADVLKQRESQGKNRGGLTFDILISHLHLDHLIGLSMFDFLFDEANNIRIFTRSRADAPLSSQIFGIFKPPYWPIDLEKMNRAEIVEIKGNETFNLRDGLKVATFDSMHDNDTTAFRIDGEKNFVYLLDFELTKDSAELNDVVAFCKDADVVVFDATYSPEDYPKRRGWGHSTFEAGMMLAELSGCKQMIFSHFFHIYTDEMIDSIAGRINRGDGVEYFVAHDGMELVL